MHRHIGHQRAGGDITRHRSAQQRLPQRRAGQFDHMEAFARQWNADDFKVFAFARQAKLQPLAACAQQRRFAGVVDRRAGAIFVFDGLIIAVFRFVELAQPGGDLGVIIGDALTLPGDEGGFPSQSRFDRAHGHRQASPLARFDNSEVGGEFDQRRRGGKPHRQRIARGIGEHAA